MMKEVNNYVTNLSSLVERPLRRSVYLSVQCSTIALLPIIIGITQSEAMGRTLALPVLYSPLTIHHSLL